MTPLETARARIADCLQRDAAGRWVQRKDSLNLAGLGLNKADLESPFDSGRREMGSVGLEYLRHLKFLDLSENQLTVLPEFLLNFKELTWLGLNFNQLASLDPGISKLCKLRRLYLRGNRLSEVPAGLGSMLSLLELDLHGNAIAELPVDFLEALRQGGKDATPGKTTLYLDIGENPCQAAVAAAQGRVELIAFLEALRQEVGKPQGKLLLVGEGRVGKSSLLRALLGKDHDDNLSTTHGLSIDPWVVENVEGFQQPVQLNCWDFSGQEQMRETHQMFFTAPALYLLVWDPDLNQRSSDDQLYEWLWLIHQSQRHGARARVLIVATNHRSRDRHEPGNKADLEKEFGPTGASILSGFASVESDNIRGTRFGIDQVRDWVRRQIADDKSFAQAVPGQWERALGRCLEVGEPLMSWDKFQTECLEAAASAAGASPKTERINVEALARQMSALGRVVWFDEPGLREQVILRPDWLSRAISYVLERATLAESDPGPESPLGRGLVTVATMNQLWRNPGTTDEGGKPHPGYAPELFPLFRRLMRRFDIVQPLVERSVGAVYEEHPNEPKFYLVPARLPRNKPSTWDVGWEPAGKVALRFNLTSRGWVSGGSCAPLNGWMARGIFGRLIVWLHPLAQGREHIEDAAHWESGFRLRDRTFGQARLLAEKHSIYFEGSVSLRGEVRKALEGLLHSLNQRFGLSLEFSEEFGCQPKISTSGAPGVCPFELADRRYFDSKFLKACLHPSPPEEPEREFRCGEKRGEKQCTLKIDVFRTLYGDEAVASKLEDKVDAMVEKLDQVSRHIDGSLVRFESSFERIGQLLQLHREVNAESKPLLQVEYAQLKELLLETLRAYDAEPTQGGPTLFSLRRADGHDFWKDMGPTLADKVELHVHCEHTLYPVFWLKHDGTKPPGVFVIENPKAWLVKAGPVIQGLFRVAGAGATLAKALGAVDVTFLKDVAETEKLLKSDLFSKPTALPGGSGDSSTTKEFTNPNQAEGEALKTLHALLREKLKTQDLARAAGLGVVRVWNKAAHRYSWVHPEFALHYGGEQ